MLQENKETDFHIIREQGEYFDAVPLSEEDNKTVQKTEQETETEQDNK